MTILRDERVIELSELEGGYFEDMVDMATIFNHEIVEITSNSERFGPKHLRWKKTNLIGNLLVDQGVVFHETAELPKQYHIGVLDLNSFWGYVSKKTISIEEAVKFYMQMGYSLSGFCEVFGQKNSFDFGLFNAISYEEDDESPENIIEWLVKTYKGTVLKNI
jgi:hypothetical protein